MVPIFKGIDIETHNFCTRKCIFCPMYADDNKKIEFMPFEMIKNIVSQLKELGFKGRITLNNYNEPLYDKRLPEIIKYIKDELPNSNIGIYTNGDLIKNKEDITNLLECGLDGMQINIYSEDRINFIENVINEARSSFGMDKFDNANNVFYEYTDKKQLYSVNKINYLDLKFSQRMRNRAGNIPWMKDVFKMSDSYLGKPCVLCFKYLTIRYNGIVPLCCDDYKNDVILGDINKDKIIDVWNSDKIRDIREKLICGRRDLIPELCSKCNNTTFYNYRTRNSWRNVINTNKYIKNENKKTKNLFKKTQHFELTENEFNEFLKGKTPEQIERLNKIKKVTINFDFDEFEENIKNKSRSLFDFDQNS